LKERKALVPRSAEVCWHAKVALACQTTKVAQNALGSISPIAWRVPPVADESSHRKDLRLKGSKAQPSNFGLKAKGRRLRKVY
jgi:hypothetical protein